MTKIRPLLFAILLTARAPAWAGPLPFDLELHVPPVITDTPAPAGCTITYLVEDTANGDLFAQRMRIASAETDQAVDHKLPCPPSVSSRVAAEALTPCTIRAIDPKTCVYADMALGFERRPDIRNTSENASRCRSDHDSHIGVACWMSGALPVCDVACGQSPTQAASQARARCEEKQQRSCPIAGSVPVALETQSAPADPDGGK